MLLCASAPSVPFSNLGLTGSTVDYKTLLYRRNVSLYGGFELKLPHIGFICPLNVHLTTNPGAFYVENELYVTLLTI